MLTNATITAIKRRSGSDKTGQPTWSTLSLARPLRCLRSGLTRAMQRTLAAEEIAADAELWLDQANVARWTAAASAAPAAGDRVQVSSETTWLEVVLVAPTVFGAVTHTTLAVQAVDRG